MPVQGISNPQTKSELGNLPTCSLELTIQIAHMMWILGVKQYVE
jgi:hypothetical protein